MNGQFLFRSLDGGATWERRPLPPDLRAQLETSFVSADEGWLVNSGVPATQYGGQGIGLWHTVDAGDTWQMLSPTGIAFQQCKDALSFIDPRRGFLGGDPNGPPTIYRTSDGGATWAASAPLPDPPGAAGVATGCCGLTLRAQRVRELGAALLVPVGAPGGAVLVYRSDDGGATWAYAGQPPTPGGALGLVTATRWIALGAPDQAMETMDAALTWHGYASDYRQAAPVPPTLVFADAAVGYATVRGAIQRTEDGGRHWGAIRSPGT
jgi:photosystem II stability/assembly factor-like uncharacterized protein